MNSINGNIRTIHSHEGLSIVEVQAQDVTFTSIILETPSTVSYLRENHPVQLHFKETEVVISKGEIDSISIENQVKGKITDIEKGILLSKVKVNTSAGTILSILTSTSIERMALKANDEVVALVKTNEIMISPN
jgi:molybdopterin-binding protein